MTPEETFVRAWGESVLRQVDRVHQVSQEAARLNRQLDRDWDPDTDEVLSGVWRQYWTEGHTLVWATYQLEQWVARLATERGEAPQTYTLLKGVRNALEHLDQARLIDHVADPGEKGNSSLRRLPGGRLLIATGGDKLFGFLTLTELATIARERLDALENAQRPFPED